MRAAAICVMLGIVTLTFACARTTSTTRTMWAEPADGEVRDGRVEWIRETVTRREGDPAAGAAAGAVVGGILGGLIAGHRAGAALGAATGAIIGAAESQEYREARTYNVAVRFDDGSKHVFTYQGVPPFRPGQAVRLTSRGLVGRDDFVAAPAPPPSPGSAGAAQPIAPVAPEPIETPPPPVASPAYAPGASTPVPRANFDGRWAYTQQYGWVWMPYGSAYTFVSHYGKGDPYMYVYLPRSGWLWVEAPWLWGWGTKPYFRVGSGVRFHWYTPGWGRSWKGGYRPSYYHNRYLRNRRPRARNRRPRVHRRR